MGYFANGTESEMYEEHYCSRCIHSDVAPGKEIGVDPPCPVWMAHQLYAYEECNSKSNAKEMLDAFIPIKTIDPGDGIPTPVNDECRMFAPIDAGAAIAGQMRLGDEAA